MINILSKSLTHCQFVMYVEFDKIPRQATLIEKITVLGDISEAWKQKIQTMNPIVQSYIGGIN